MSAERQQRKPGIRAIFARTGLVLLLFAGLPSLPGSRAATTERIVVNPNRGLALNGFDPVAYFTDSRPLMGREDIELCFAGATLRVRNEGTCF